MSRRRRSFKATGYRPAVRSLPFRAEDSCGCAMSARFLLVGLVAALAWYAWRWYETGSSAWSYTWHVLAWSFGAAMVGKILGILSFRYRSRRGSVVATRSHRGTRGRMAG
jgi:hypothetical protein